jgi:hypothetical protein
MPVAWTEVWKSKKMHLKTYFLKAHARNTVISKPVIVFTFMQFTIWVIHCKTERTLTLA